MKFVPNTFASIFMVAFSVPLLIPHIAVAVEIRGHTSCGKWQSERANSQINYAETWLMGYLSGYAVGRSRDFLKGTDNASIFYWMDTYCRSNPLRDTVDGADLLIRELQIKRGV